MIMAQLLSTLEEFDEGEDWKADHFYSTEDDASSIQEELTVEEEALEIGGDEASQLSDDEDENQSVTPTMSKDSINETTLSSSTSTSSCSSSSTTNQETTKLLDKRGSMQSKIISSKETSGISSQAEEESAAAEEETGKLFHSIKSRSKSANLRPISPYETHLLEETLREFIDRTGKSKKNAAATMLLPHQFSIVHKLEEAKLQWRKEKFNNMVVLQKKVLELTDENRVLNRLVKRQSVVLDRLTSNSGELPSLLTAHNEELRIMRQRMKQAQEMNRQFEEKLKLRDAEIFRMREATHLLQKNSVLNSRRQSTRTSISRDTGYEADELRNIVEDKEHELSKLRHNLYVTKKSSKQQLNNEVMKNRDLLKQLEAAKDTIKELQNVIKEKDKQINHGHIYSHRRFPSRMAKSSRYFNGGTLSSASSMISLAPALIQDDQINSTQSLKQLDKDLEEEFEFDHPSDEVKKEVIEETKVPEINKSSTINDEVKDDEVAQVEPEVTEEPIKDEFEGFYDNVADEALDEVKKEDIKEECIIEKSEEKEEDAQDAKEEVPKEIIIERQNSFKSTKKFFQDSGTLIEPKQYKKTDADEEPALDEAKKQELLASLNALDDSSGYEPSFIGSSITPPRQQESRLMYHTAANNDTFNSSAFKSLDSSINSVKSSLSVDSDKKAKLMQELFSHQ